MKVITGKTSKVIADVLAQIDQKEFARTQKRLMLAAKIDEAMRRKGYNQRQFAKLMGKSTTVISEWLSGERNFTSDTLVDIEEALGIQLLDVTTMTTVNAKTESVIKAQRNARKIAMRPRSSWTLTNILSQTLDAV
ncbi:MAG: helix-turn-helix transcriptional regulator [Prevotella sp.]|nr:helix-turn-helix transcriptional regulator [Prevotella sp.]